MKWNVQKEFHWKNLESNFQDKIQEFLNEYALGEKWVGEGENKHDTEYDSYKARIIKKILD